MHRPAKNGPTRRRHDPARLGTPGARLLAEARSLA